jgi:hypothetical protein
MKRLSIYILLFSCCMPAHAQPPGTVQLVTPFGKPDGKETAAKIGKDGGTLASEDGRIELVIPPGALSKKTTISIQPVVNALPGARGKSYHLQPSGITFNQPVRITFHYDDKESNGNDPRLRGIAMQDEQGRWHHLPGAELDSVNKKISGKISHFSYWVDYETVIITPPAAKVKVNKEISLQLTVLTPPDTDGDTAPGEDYLPPLPLISHVIAPTAPVWSANAVINGNAKTGTIRSMNERLNCIYKAPAVVPDQNPVAVTAELRNVHFKIGNNTFTTLKVTSNILVYDENTFEVKMEAWVDQTSLSCGQRAIDEGGFIVQVRNNTAKVTDIKNSLVTIPVRSSCPCNLVWTNQSVSVGPIHITGVQSITVRPPNPPEQPYHHVRILFLPAMAVHPIFYCPKGALPAFPPIPAFPRMIDFFAKKEEQILYEIKESMMGLKITVRQMNEEE